MFMHNQVYIHVCKCIIHMYIHWGRLCLPHSVVACSSLYRVEASWAFYVHFATYPVHLHLMFKLSYWWVLISIERVRRDIWEGLKGEKISDKQCNYSIISKIEWNFLPLAGLPGWSSVGGDVLSLAGTTCSRAGWDLRGLPLLWENREGVVGKGCKLNK